MSSVDPARRHREERGYTLIEISVVLILLTSMSLIVERTLTSTNRADAYMGAMRRAKERSESASFRVYEAVSASRRLFENDTEGAGYLSALDLSRFSVAAGARLPSIDELHPLGPDRAGDPRTGNILLFVREVDPISACADVTQFPQRLIDVYHFVCCYPHQTSRNLITDNLLHAKDLVIWYSIPFPSYKQISAISDPLEKQKILQILRETYGFDHLWDVCCPVDQAFFRINEAGVLSASPEVDFVIPEHPGISEGGLLEHYDAQLAPTDPSRRLRSGIFTTETATSWVPDGFEVKITGPSGHRKVWLHTVVETQALRGETAVHASTLIASVRDL